MKRENIINLIRASVLSPIITTYEGLPLPARQETGTAQQKVSYAQQAAEDFYKKYEDRLKVPYSEDQLVTIALNMNESPDKFIRLLGVQIHCANYNMTLKLYLAFKEEFKKYLIL